MKKRPTPQKKSSALDKPRHYTAQDLFSETLPPVEAASWPNDNTRAYEALQALLTGPQNQADYRDGWRLAASVKLLEYGGWAFCKRDIRRPHCRSTITEYALDRQHPATAAALNARQQRGSISLGSLVVFASASVTAAVVAAFARLLGVM